MRDYGKVHTAFWSSATTRELSEDGRTLALYLLTCPHGTIAGVFRLPDGYACEDLQWTPERVNEGFAELLAKGFANRCETTKWAWIVKHFDWNPPENPNQRKAVAKMAAQVPASCGWKPEFMRVCGRFWGAEPTKEPNPSETLPEPFLNQEQYQEQYQEQEGVQGEMLEGTDGDDPSASPAAPPTPAAKKTKARTGTRLPDRWQLPKSWGDWAMANRPDMDADAVRREAEIFADHWRGKAGADARKADWEATWRNWVRRSNGLPRSSGATAKSGVGTFV